MIRIVTLTAVLVAAAPASAQITDPRVTDPPKLRAEVAVANEFVRIGDLVENAGALANIAVFRSPDLGQVGTVPVAQVMDAIRAHHVVGLDIGSISEVTVKRPSRIITNKDLETRVVQALAAQRGTPDKRNLAVSFDGEVRALQVDAAVATELPVSRLSFDPRSNRFDIVFDVPSSTGAQRVPLRLTGSVVETAEAAVLLRSIERGEIVRVSDISVEQRPKSEVTNDVFTASTPAIGRSAKRALQAGQVLHQPDLMKPELVQRNDIVTIVYEMPGIMLTVRGKALDSGADGDIVNVMNIQSKRNIQAAVTGPGRVSVVTIAPASTQTTTVAASPDTDTTGTTARSE